MKTVEEICLRRKDSKMSGNDYLDSIIEEANKHDFLNDNSVTKLVFVILFAGYEATSQAVADHPDVLDELTVCLHQLLELLCFVVTKLN